MSFVHDDPSFDGLLRIVADKREISVGLVEKDYWVTHVLWALQGAGFDLWFKGGTSLSKGFGLIERFSEDLDLKLEPGRIAGIPAATDWKREGTQSLPPLEGYGGPRELAEEMLREKQIKPVPRVDHPAFKIQPNARGQTIRNAFDAIAPTYWGSRRTLDECIETIQGWIREVGFASK